MVEETIDYVLREMTAPDGGFYSTQDADSEGEEGKFFVWTPAEIEAVLGAQDAAILNSVYGVTARGNFEGQRFCTVRTLEDVASAARLAVEEVETRLAAMREKLFDRARKSHQTWSRRKNSHRVERVDDPCFGRGGRCA